MGKRGPQPKPTAQKKLEGNPGRRPIDDRELAFECWRPAMPGLLGKEGRKTWKSVAAVLVRVKGLLTVADGGALSLYCEAWEEFLNARAEIAKSGATCKTDAGAVYQHPAVGRKNKAIERIKAFGAKFGLSPSDRVGLKLVGPSESADPLDEMLLERAEEVS